MTPRAVGLPEVGIRRVPGLRREEVAQLAGDQHRLLHAARAGPDPRVRPRAGGRWPGCCISSDEQGPTCSSWPVAPVRTASPAARYSTCSRNCAGCSTTCPRPRRLVLGRRLDVLAWNPWRPRWSPTSAAFRRRNATYIAAVFPTPRTGALPTVDGCRTHGVAQLRRRRPRYPDDPRLAELVGELSLRDDDFRQWWGSTTWRPAAGAPRPTHPIAGDLTLDWDTLTCTTDAEQQLVVWTAEPGSRAHDGLRILASWAAREPADAPTRG